MQYTYEEKKEQKNTDNSEVRHAEGGLIDISDRAQISSRVVIISDYDADGICSAYIMNRLFELMTPQLPIVNIIGDREKDGYGIPDDALNVVQKGDLVVVLDMGFNDHEMLRKLHQKAGNCENQPYGGLVCIDHHEYEHKEHINHLAVDWYGYKLCDWEPDTYFVKDILEKAPYVKRWLMTDAKGNQFMHYGLPECAFPKFFDLVEGSFTPDYCTTGICFQLMEEFIKNPDKYRFNYYADYIISHPDLYTTDVVENAQKEYKVKESDPKSGIMERRLYQNVGCGAKWGEVFRDIHVPSEYYKEKMESIYLTPEYEEKFGKALNTAKILACIGTIADVCKVNNVYDKNKDIILDGFKSIRLAHPETQPPSEEHPEGTFATDTSIGYLLMRLGAYNTSYLGTRDIGFTIAPIFNAAGRMKEYGGIHLLNALLAQQPRAVEIDEYMELNGKRKRIQNEIVNSDEYVSFVNEMKRPGAPKIAMFITDNIPRSLAGIIAGKLSEELKRPAIVLTSAGTKHMDAGKYTGSGRNYEGYPSLLNMVSSAKDLTVNMGGHADAIGLSCDGAIKAYELQKKLQILYSGVVPKKCEKDYMILPERLTPQMLYDLEPFGPDYPAPCIKEDVVVDNVKQLKNNYCSFEANGMKFLGQNMSIENGDKITVEGELSISHFAGVESVQVVVKSYESEGMLEGEI